MPHARDFPLPLAPSSSHSFLSLRVPRTRPSSHSFFLLILRVSLSPLTPSPAGRPHRPLRPRGPPSPAPFPPPGPAPAQQRRLGIARPSLNDINAVLAGSIAEIFLPAASLPAASQSPAPTAPTLALPDLADIVGTVCPSPLHKIVSVRAAPQISESSLAFTTVGWDGTLRTLRQMAVIPYTLTPYTLHLSPTPAPYTLLLLPTPYTLHPTPHAEHPTPYALHPTPNTLHPMPYTLNPIP